MASAGTPSTRAETSVGPPAARPRSLGRVFLASVSAAIQAAAFIFRLLGVASLASNPPTGWVAVTGHFPRVGERHDGRTVIGHMSRRVEDLEAVLRLIAGPDGVDGGCVPVPLTSPPNGRGEQSARLRVAVIEDEGGWRPSASTAAAARAAVDALVDRGAAVVGDVFRRTSTSHSTSRCVTGADRA
jgi:hypothetical protein